MLGGGTLKNAILTLKFPNSNLFRLFRVAPSVAPSVPSKKIMTPCNIKYDRLIVINDLIVLAKPGGTVEFLNVEFNVGTMYVHAMYNVHSMYIRCTFNLHLHSSTHVIFMYFANTGKEETNLILLSIT